MAFAVPGGPAAAAGWVVCVGAGALVTAATMRTGLAHRVRRGRRPLPRAAVWGPLALAIVVAMAAVMVALVGTDAIADVLAGIDGRALAGVLVLEAAALASLAQVYRATYAVEGGCLRYRDALTVALGAFSLTQLLPGGGAAGGVFAIRRLRAHGADPIRAAATVLLFGLVTMGTLGLVVSLATTVTAVTSGRYTGYAVASSLVTLGVLGGLVLLRQLTGDRRRRERLAGRLGRLRWRGRPFAAAWADGLQQHGGVLRHPATLRRPVGWSALNWSLDVGVLGLLLHAFGAGAPLLAVLVGFAVANLLNGLPITPGGVGMVEAGLAGTLIGFGADPAATSVAVLGYRAVAFWLPVLVAGPVVVSGLRARPLVTGTAS